MSLDRCHRHGGLSLRDALAAWARSVSTLKHAPPSQDARTPDRCRSPRRRVFGVTVAAQTRRPHGCAGGQRCDAGRAAIVDQSSAETRGQSESAGRVRHVLKHERFHRPKVGVASGWQTPQRRRCQVASVGGDEGRGSTHCLMWSDRPCANSALPGFGHPDQHVETPSHYSPDCASAASIKRLLRK